jgi:putative aldouronate transport system substrate-binding protein
MIYNVKISTPTTAYSDDFMKVYKSWDDEALPSVTFGFSIDYTNIQTEKANIDAVYEELAVPMLVGIKDYDSNIEELQTQLKEAGWDKYVAEIQRQFDEFLASK